MELTQKRSREKGQDNVLHVTVDGRSLRDIISLIDITPGSCVWYTKRGDRTPPFEWDGGCRYRSKMW